MLGRGRNDAPPRSIDRRARNDMNKTFAFADRDMTLALRHEFASRHNPMALAELLGFFVEACWDKFWAADRARKTDTLAAFRDDALTRIETLRLRHGPVPADPDARARVRRDARDAALLGYDAYSDAFDLDLERLRLFPDAHTRLAETAILGSVRLFRGDTDIDRGQRMLIGRLHGYMRAAVWHIENR